MVDANLGMLPSFIHKAPPIPPSSEKASVKRDSVSAGYVAAPYYPAPKGGWVNTWTAAYAKAQAVVAQMTLAEKSSALRFGIPSLCLQDSALGIAATDGNTAFPPGITTGATWSKDLAYQRGLALGAEAREKGVNILLGPTVGPIGRKPRGGRNWEGFGADPVLQGVSAAQTINGIQANGVIATIKHFIGNEQEAYRMDIIPHGLKKAISSNIDDRTLHEFYMWPFAEGIRAGVGAVMTSYNDVNGSAASQNSYLINNLLKDELGFQGLVMTDWLAQIGGVSSALAGLDMAMPGDGGIPFTGEAYWAYELSTAILNGTVPLDRLNDMVTRIVSTCTLPLSTSAALKVFGSDSANNPAGPNACNQRGCDTGVLGMGWGSGTANYPYLDAPIDAIKRKASNVYSSSSDSFPSGLTALPGDIAIVFINSDSGENSITVEGNDGDRSSSGLYAWHNGDALVKAAAAKYSTVVVVVHTVGPILVENWIDLPSVKSVLFAHLPGQEAGNSLADILFGVYSPSGHLPYSIPVSESNYPPSASLVGFALGQVQDTFSEGLYVDYRYLNKNAISPRFPFGHGLSYTTFSRTVTLAAGKALTPVPPARAAKGSTPAYSTAIPPASEVSWPANFSAVNRYLYPYLDNPSNITTGKFVYPTGYTNVSKPDPPSGGSQGGNPALWDTMFTLSVTVTNTGPVAGKSVAQLYVQYPSDSPYDTPIIQLRDYAKTDTLAPGGNQVVSIVITRKDISVWDVTKQNWVIPISTTKPFLFWVGDSSGNLTLACESISGACSAGRTSPVV
ncbi:hypothetical protein DID88_006936 [Monilinia fructigena]|uniref:beta-glucosidase n=1 Tax=Monilinia fructigena TaxID=38457 RepID=A0A395IGP1_9HELO|nr:hypothetical protein DID88_006936 [Monilinia fructigena]